MESEYSHSYNLFIFYLYFNFIFGSWFLLMYYLYRLLNNQIIEHTNKFQKILFAINERFDVVEDSFVEKMDYAGILKQVEMIKID